MNYPEMTSFNQLEVPVAVKQILQKLDGEQIVRGRREIAEQLERIQNKVERVLDRSREITEIEAQNELALKQHGDENQKRTLLLDKLKHVLNSSALIQCNLEQVLLWLSGICNRAETLDKLRLFDEDTEVNTDQWIIDKEKELSHWLDFILQCLAKLTDVFSITSDVEVPTVQNKKGRREDGLSRWRKKEHNGNLLAKMKYIAALSLEKMLEDEEIFFLKSTELLQLLQDHIPSPYPNTTDSEVFQHIMQILSTLSKAFSLRSKEFHEMEKEFKAKAAQEVNLNAKYTALSTELRCIQEKMSALEMRLHTAEARFESSIVASRQHMAHIDKKPSEWIDRSQQCDQVQCTDSETQTLGPMNTAKCENDYILPSDFQTNDMIYIKTEDENLKIGNDERQDENTHVVESFECWENISSEKDSSQHEQSLKDSSLIIKDTIHLPQSRQSHELDMNAEIQVKQENPGERIQKHENMSSPPPGSDVCDHTGVPLSLNQKQPRSTNLNLCEQTDDDTDERGHLMVREFQQAVHYLLDHKLSCVGIKNEEIMEKNAQENEMLKNFHPIILNLYKETKAKIEDSLMKVKDALEHDLVKHIQLNKTTVMPSAVQKMDISQLPKVLPTEFNKALQHDDISNNVIINLGTSSTNINLPRNQISENTSCIKPTGDIVNSQQVQRKDMFEGYNDEMGPLCKNPESKDREQPSKLHFNLEQMYYNPQPKFEKREEASINQYITRQGSQHNVMSTDDDKSTQHFYMDVRSQRINLRMLRKARIRRTIPQHLQPLATDLMLRASENAVIRLGNLFHKYIAFHLIQSVRNNLIRRTTKKTHRGKENEIMELQLFLRRLDEYQRKIFQRWADKQAHAEHEHSNCLHAMVALFEKIGNEHDLHLSCSQLSQEKEARHEEEYHYSSPDRFITWRSSPTTNSNIMSEKGRNLCHSSRKPVDGIAAGIWKIDICDKSFRLGKKQSLPSLWQTLGVFPEIPRLLELDVSLPRIRALRCMHTKDKDF